MVNKDKRKKEQIKNKMIMSKSLLNRAHYHILHVIAVNFLYRIKGQSLMQENRNIQPYAQVVFGGNRK